MEVSKVNFDRSNWGNLKHTFRNCHKPEKMKGSKEYSNHYHHRIRSVLPYFAYNRTFHQSLHSHQIYYENIVKLRILD